MPRLSNHELMARLDEVLSNLDLAIASVTGTPEPQVEAALERWLQLSIQVLIDLGDRVVAARGLPEPARSREIFEVLAREGLLSPADATGMGRLVSLRNDLVPDYGEFTPATTPGHVRRALPLIRAVGKALADALTPR
ncbi:MAG: DUF86 domain-containing protein [Actinomycetota bacterium]